MCLEDYHTPTQEEYNEAAKQQVNNLHSELYDITVRANIGLIGQLERDGYTTVVSDLINALAKLELLKQSL